MPKLPTEENRGQFDFLNKPIPNPGGLVLQGLGVNKKHLKLPIKRIIGVLILVVVLGGIYIGTNKYFPDLFKQKAPAQAEAKPFEYPLNVNDVTFPNEIVKEKFLADIRNAAAETNTDKRFGYLADSFSLMQGFYSATGSYDYRVQLQKYREYLKKNYPKQFEATKGNFDFACIDKLCGEAKYPTEIAKIIGEVTKNTKIDPLVKESVLRNFDGAGFSKDKNVQINFYLGSLSMLFSEANRTSDVDLKTSYFSLLNFIENTYSEIKVPAQIKLQVEEK